MTEQTHPVDPAPALLLVMKGYSADYRVDPTVDPAGARIYQEVTELLTSSDEGFYDASSKPIDHIFAEVATLLHRLNRNGVSTDQIVLDATRVDINHAMREISNASPIDESNSRDTIGISLIFVAYQYGIVLDDELLWDCVCALMDQPLYMATVHALDHLCILASSRSTPSAACRWARLRYKLLRALQEIDSENQDPISARFDSISEVAELVCAINPSHDIGVRWVMAATLDTLKDMETFARSGLDASDDWLGSTLYICDALISAEQTELEVKVV